MKLMPSSKMLSVGLPGTVFGKPAILNAHFMVHFP